MIHQSFKIKSIDQVSIAFDHYGRQKDKLIIIAPGFYNSKEALLLKQLAHDLHDEYDVAVMDFRGHGASEGLFYWTSKEHMDLLSVVEHMHPQYKKIGLIGFSLGAATALITSSKTPLINSVVAVSPPTEFEKIEYRWWELSIDHDILYSLFGQGRIGKGVRPGPWWLPKEKPKNIITKVHQPVLYIHGTADWIIKPWHSQHLYDLTVGKKHLEIIKEAPHAEYLMRSHKKQVVGVIRQWFKETMV